MNRREAIRNVTLLVGGSLSVATIAALNQGCQTVPAKKDDSLFNEEQESTIAEMADAIIPDTDTPGAKAAGVGPFIVMMIKDCYPENTQKAFIEGIDEVQKRSQTAYNKSFISLPAADRLILLKKIEQDAEDQKTKTTADKTPADSPHFFKLFKELALLGYFTSEIGATQALNYVAIPGRYDSCIPLQKGQKAWAT